MNSAELPHAISAPDVAMAIYPLPVTAKSRFPPSPMPEMPRPGLDDRGKFYLQYWEIPLWTRAQFAFLFCFFVAMQTMPWQLFKI